MITLPSLLIPLLLSPMTWASESPRAETLQNAVLTFKEAVKLDQGEYWNQLNLVMSAGTRGIVSSQYYGHCEIQGEASRKLKEIPAGTEFLVQRPWIQEKRVIWELTPISDNLVDTYIDARLDCYAGLKTDALQMNNVRYALGKKVLSLSSENQAIPLLKARIERAQAVLDQKLDAAARTEAQAILFSECPAMNTECLLKFKLTPDSSLQELMEENPSWHFVRRQAYQATLSEIRVGRPLKYPAHLSDDDAATYFDQVSYALILNASMRGRDMEEVLNPIERNLHHGFLREVFRGVDDSYHASIRDRVSEIDHAHAVIQSEFRRQIESNPLGHDFMIRFLNGLIRLDKTTRQKRALDLAVSQILNARQPMQAKP